MSGLLSNTRRKAIKTSDIVDFQSAADSRVAAGISTVVGGAPALLDTLSELATAVGDDAAFASSVLLKSGGTMTGALNMGSQAITNAASVGTSALSLGGVSVTSSAAEINRLSGVVPGTPAAGKAVVTNGSNQLAGFASLDTISLAINGTAVSATALELSRCGGLTAGLAAPNKVVTCDASSNVANINQVSAATVATASVTGASLALTAPSGNLSLSASSGNVNVAAGSFAVGNTVLSSVSSVNRAATLCSGVTEGAATANRVLTTDGTVNVSGLTSLGAASVVCTAVTTASVAPASGDLTISAAGGLVNISSGSLALGGSAVTASAAELNRASNITPGAAMANKLLSVDGSLAVTGISTLGATSAVETPTVSGMGLSLIATTGNLSLASTSGSVACAAPLLVAGIAPSAAGTLTNVTINTSSAITGVSASTSYITIGVANSGRCLIRLDYGGNVLVDGQRITVCNKTTVLLTLGHRATSSAGALRCAWFELQPSCTIDLVFESATASFVAPGVSLPIGEWRSFRWSGDQSLNLFCGASIGSYIAKINFDNATSTINGVSGFENASTLTGTFTGTNWSITNSGSAWSAYTAANAAGLTDTESAKLANFHYNGSAWSVTFSGLTRGKIYALFAPSHVFDSSATVRVAIFTESDSGTKYPINGQVHMLGSGSNDVGSCWSYIWRHDSTSLTTRSFSVTNSSYHLFSLICAEISP